MSFRKRLLLFFAIIVVVPMVAIGAVLFSLAGHSERGKADAGIAIALDVARSLYTDGRAAADGDLRRFARDARLSTAWRAGDTRVAGGHLRRLVAAHSSVVSATLFGPAGRVVARAGSPQGVAPAAATVTTRAGERLGTLAVSVTDARSLVASVRRGTRLDAVVLRAGRPVAASDSRVRTVPEGSADFSAAGKDYRGHRARVGNVSDVAEDIAVFRDSAEMNGAISSTRLLISGILLAFVLVAMALSVFVVRALQGQIGEFLDAARRLATGRFDQPVTLQGNDEFAQLGREFNSMSEQLAAKIGEVERKHRELEGTIRRVGEAFATGADRDRVLALTVETSMEACAADYGRGLPLDARTLTEARAGPEDPVLRAAVEKAERRATAPGPDAAHALLEPRQAIAAPPEQRQPVAVEHSGVHALALPLLACLGRRAHAEYIAVLSIARRGHAFNRQEVGMLSYLAGQAVVSIEHADLHETVQRQASTDELTGLANVREMQEALDREFERGYRHDTPVGFVLLDIDDFKKVNDTYGHQQGDEVLARVSAVLRDHSRDIDEPARYGGEELAVVLPQTDIAGARWFAERVRESLERMRIPLLGSSGEIGITASLGVASVPASAAHKDTLIAAADAALYRAKRGGKNRVEVAEPTAVPG